MLSSSHIRGLLVLASCVLFDGAAACAPSPLPPLVGTIDESLSVECILAIGEADRFWSELLGVDHVFILRGGTHLADRGPEYREVIFQPGAPEGYDGWARSTSDAVGRLYSGRVQLRNDHCTMPSVAHEYGHLLGLVHRDDPDALMFSAARGGTQVTDDEIETALDRVSP